GSHSPFPVPNRRVSQYRRKICSVRLVRKAADMRQTKPLSIVDAAASTTANLGEERAQTTGQPPKRVYVFIDPVPEEQLVAELQEQGAQARVGQEEQTIEQAEASPPGARIETVPQARGARKPSRLLMLWIPPCLLALLAMLAGGFVYV